METWRTLFDRGAEWGATEADLRAALAARREDGVTDVEGEEVRAEDEDEDDDAKDEDVQAEDEDDDAEGDGDA